MKIDQPLLTWERFVRRDEEDLDVATGAALIARDHYPNLDVRRILAPLDDLAQPLIGRDLDTAPPEVQAETLGHHLFVEGGFRGNEADYADPRNSLLPDVFQRRLGIPITLALVYTEVARRVGVPAYGVGFPGHFLVRIERRRALPAAPKDLRRGREPELPFLIDPFDQGRQKDRAGLTELLKRALGPAAKLREDHFMRATPRATLVRMLTNLKGTYLARRDLARAHLALDRIVMLEPNDVLALRERAALSKALGANEAARADLQRVLELTPDALDAPLLKGEVDALRGGRNALN